MTSEEGGHRAALAELPAPRFVSMAWHRLEPRAVRSARSTIAKGLAGKSARSLDGVAEAHSYQGDPDMLRALADVSLIEPGTEGAPNERRACSAYRVGYLARAAARDEAFSDEEVDALVESARSQARGLSDESPPSIDTAAALVALAGYLGDLAGVEAPAAEAALRAAAESQLTSEGVHRSGSPGLHVEVLNRVAAVLEAGLTGDPVLVRMRHEMEEALAWMVAPDGSLVEIGETRPRLIGGLYAGYSIGAEAMRSVYRNPSLLHAATAGEVGSAPPDGWRVFPEAGVAVHKVGWPGAVGRTEGAAYLALQGDSSLRNHEDDLNIVWFDRNRWLLTGSGHGADPDQGVRPDQRFPTTSNGDDREDTEAADTGPPAEVAEAYVRTRPAHNVVDLGLLVGLRSELVGWGTRRGVQVIEAESTSEGVAHHRIIAVVPGAWLLVADVIGGGSGHRLRWPRRSAMGPPATVWFHGAPDLDVHLGSGGVVMSATGTPVAWVAQTEPGWTPVGPHRGGSGVDLLGWGIGRDGRPEKRWAFGWNGPTPGRSAVLFTLDAPAKLDRESDSLRWETPAGRGRVSWSDIGITDLEWNPVSGR